MKAALVCLIVLSALLGSSFFYSVKMADTAADLAQHTTAILKAENAKRAEKIKQLDEEWKTKEIWFSLSVPHSELDRIETELVHVASAEKTKNDSEFQLAVALLADAFEHIGRLYEASLDNIL